MRTFIFALVLCVVASRTLAQAGPIRPQPQLPQVGIGTRIRVLSNRAEYIGRLVDFDSAAIALDHPEQGQVKLPLPVNSVWISGGRHRHTIMGALIGAALGAALTVTLGDDVCDGGCGDAGVPTYLAVGALDGGAYGAVIGWFVRSERWNRASLPPLTSHR